MKLFDIFKNRKYHDIFKKNGIETISCDKLHKSKMNFVKSLEEEMKMANKIEIWNHIKNRLPVEGDFIFKLLLFILLL